MKEKKKKEAGGEMHWIFFLTNGLIATRASLYPHDKLNLILNYYNEITNNKSSSDNKKAFQFSLHFFFSFKYSGANRHYLQRDLPHPSPLCEERCDGVSEAGCLTRRPAAAVVCCGHSCSHYDACLVHHSECLGCAVLSS